MRRGLAVALLVVAVAGAVARPSAVNTSGFRPGSTRSARSATSHCSLGWCRGDGCPSGQWCLPSRSPSSPVASWPHAFGRAGNGGLAGFGTGVVAGDALNNLPATLVTVRHVSHVGEVWSLRSGLSIGPSLVITGSLAGLLLQASARASGVRITAGRYSRGGAIVGVPAMAVGIGTLRVLR